MEDDQLAEELLAECPWTIIWEINSEGTSLYIKRKLQIHLDTLYGQLL